MTIEIEEVTVKDGIVRITALNCSEENLQKLERLRDDCYQKELQFVFDTRNNKSDCIYLTYYFINYYSQRMKAQKGDHYDDRNERKNDLP